MGIPTGWSANRNRSFRADVTVTREVRWFRDGPLPRDVLTWFGDGVAVHHERRRDRYDPATANVGVGLKYRGDASVDAKYLMSPESVEDLADGIRGRVGDWVKVSRPVAGSNLLRDELVPVEKRLRTRIYEFDADGIGFGCEVELGEIATPWGAAWSLCFETTGPAEHRHAAIHSGVRRFLGETPLPSGLVLAVDDSYAYPQWLTQQRVAA